MVAVTDGEGFERVVRPPGEPNVLIAGSSSLATIVKWNLAVGDGRFSRTKLGDKLLM